MKAVAALLLIGISVTACGKKGPPLPPLVRVPAAPGDFSAVRRASTVAIHFVIPRGNTDGSTPADLTHVDVYALDAATAPSSDDVLKRGMRVGRIEVNPPPDPDAVGDEQALADPAAVKDRDQGATARLSETLGSDDVSATAGNRSYVAVGFSKRGRHGTFAARVDVPLGPSPAAPSAPRVTYDETTITITWSTVASGGASHLYLGGAEEQRLNGPAVTDAKFEDHQMTWGVERCYVVRSVETRDGLLLESEGSAPTCVTPVDTFAPKSPVGLQAIASEGAVNLIWDANAESDLAGYHVLRAIAPDTNLSLATPSLIATPTFTDTVPTGARVTYAVEAVDKAGNVSAASARVAETAR